MEPFKAHLFTSGMTSTLLATLQPGITIYTNFIDSLTCKKQPISCTSSIVRRHESNLLLFTLLG